MLARHQAGGILRDEVLVPSVLKCGATAILDGRLEDDTFSLLFDGLERVEGKSGIGDFHYVPVLYYHGERIPREQRLLLTIYGLILEDLQGKQPGGGMIVRGKESRVTKVQFIEDIRKARRLLEEVKVGRQSGAVPRLTLNDHCSTCEFQERCQAQASKDDDLSLLRGMSEQEIGRQNRKGIFTVRQISYTFRVRRTNKRAKSKAFPHSFALQALAIRENKVHVHGAFAFPTSPTSIYLDMEGVPGRDSYYLIGLVVVENGVESCYSFWADDEAAQTAIFGKLLEKLGEYAEYRLFTFGNYETRALRRIKHRLPEERQGQVDGVLRKTVNVLSILYAHIYFPTYSCGLKSIGRYLGYSWSEPDASGIQSVAWRTAWERSRDESLKAKLLQYNTEDCLALKEVVAFLARIAPSGTVIGESGTPPREVIHTEDFPRPAGHGHLFQKQEPALPGFDYLNKCAYFDHQRAKVFVRTNPRLKSINRRKRRARRRALRINKVVELHCMRCPDCNSKKLIRIGDRARQIIDFRYFRDGVKRWVTKYLSWRYRCTKCGAAFMHPEYPQATTKYGRGLISWCIYQHITCGQNILRLKRGLKDVFKLSIPQPQLYRFKTSVAQYYQTTYTRILDAILKGPVIHVDETEVHLRGRTGYVWVLTNMEQVYFFYRDSREGPFLKEMLRGFAGVLVSDFFTAYDSLDCPQQKCLIHLLRDLNEDVLKNPFDEEFRTLAHGFSSLLRKVVETIDRYGLMRRHLHKHRPAIEAFFDRVGSDDVRSDVARGYQRRFEKYRGKLFAFVDYDGIPWNNNNAEHAIKCFAKYREFANGRFTEASIKDYLTILSIYQSCEYQGVNFLEVLRGKGDDAMGEFGSGVRMVRVTKGETTPIEQSETG